MAATRSYLLKPSPDSPTQVRAVIETVNYHGCTITLRSEVTANGRICASYEVVANSNGATWVFKGTSEGLPETSDPQYLLEVAKCEIDFALEVDF